MNNSRKQKFLPYLMALIVCLNGCYSVGPEYSRQMATRPLQDPLIELDTTEIADGRAWWKQIHDPQFEKQLRALFENNLSLQAAAERVLQAREGLVQAGSNQYPSVDLTGSARRSFLTNTQGDRDYLNTFNAGLEVGWQVDLFGRIERSKQTAEALFYASEADREALLHSLVADMARRYLAVSVNSRLAELAERNLLNRKTFYDLLKRRYDRGASGVSLEDVYLAEESLFSVQSETFEFERLLVEELYRLDVILGRRPGTTGGETAAGFPLFANPAHVPPVIPAALLDRRPDLRAHEFRMIAANAELGVAIADLYPSLSLTGQLGLENANLSDILDIDSLMGSLIGGIVQPLFTGGRLQSNRRLEESKVRELALNYSNMILEAIREVETALQADRELSKQLLHEQKSLEALKAAERLSKNRYENGLLSLRSYLETQQRRYRAEQQWLRTVSLRWNTRITLYLALGGDLSVEGKIE